MPEDDLAGDPGHVIRIVCPNPALDRLQVVPGLRTGAVNRARRVVSLAGGKGMIVARGVRRQGRPAALLGFAGGAIGAMIRQGCRDLGVVDGHVEVAGETRITSVIVDEATGASTVINEQGPQVDADDAAELLAALAAQVVPDDLVVTTGSVPPGAGADLHARVAEVVADRGGRVLVDTHGAPLAAAVGAAPWLVKPNLAELRDLLGAELPPDDLPRVVEAMAAVRDRGARIVVVTLGRAGVLALDDRGAVHVASPQVEVANATGSGDMLLAGLVVALAGGADLGAALVRGVAAGAANAERVEPDVDADRIAELARGVGVEPVGGAQVA